MNPIALTVLNFLTRVTRPNHWIKLHDYDRELDQWLLKQIKEDTYVSPGYLTCCLGYTEVWVGNYPYSYGWVYPSYKRHCGSYVAVKLKRYLKRKETEDAYS